MSVINCGLPTGSFVNAIISAFFIKCKLPKSGDITGHNNDLDTKSERKINSKKTSYTCN